MVSVLSYNFRRVIRIFAVNIQCCYSGCTFSNNWQVTRLKVIGTDRLKYAWTCSKVKHFTYVTLNSVFLSASSPNSELFRNRTCNPSPQIIFEHAVQNRSRAIFHNFLWTLWKIWDFCLLFFRVVELICVFVPLIILFPLTWTNIYLKNLWYKLLLFDLEFSGPIFVKLGQWASTRRDLFPEELCSCLSKLQRKTKVHSWFYTKSCLERAFGPQWKHIFVKFENNKEPVGSGCCAQVYKVWLDPEALTIYSDNEEVNKNSEDSLFVEGIEMFGVGKLLGTKDRKWDETAERLTMEQKLDNWDNPTKKGYISVAVKVRHPRMESLLRRDLNIMKSVASAVTWIVPSLKWLSLVDCVEDFEQLMKAQVDLCVEACNLEQFSANFVGVESVKFPQPFWPLTRQYLLVETFEEGKPMQHYIATKSTKQIKTGLAELGINTILKMVFDDNFAHGDLHPGNILVIEKEDGDLMQKESKKMFPFTIFSKSSPLPVSIVILDCGIIAALDDRGKKCLRGVFTAVANGDGEKVGELFLNHSNHQCTDPESFKRRMSEIVSSTLDKNITLEEIEVSTLMTSLFSALIDHKVKLDGSFSSIILAIMVVEGLGRSLDPTVDVMEKARPFLLSSL